MLEISGDCLLFHRPSIAADIMSSTLGVEPINTGFQFDNVKRLVGVVKYRHRSSILGPLDANLYNGTHICTTCANQVRVGALVIYK